MRFRSDPVVIERFAKASRLADVDPSPYVAVFYVGGHGPAIDLPTDPDNIALANKVRLLPLSRLHAPPPTSSSAVLPLREDRLRCVPWSRVSPTSFTCVPLVAEFECDCLAALSWA